MRQARFVTMIASLVLLGGLADRVQASAQEPEKRQDPASSKAQAGAGVKKPPAKPSKLGARIEIARQIVHADLDRLKLIGPDRANPLGDIPFWSRRLMEDLARRAGNPEERRTAIREHQKRMIELESILGDAAKEGQIRKADAAKASYFRLQADQLLLEAGEKPEKKEADPTKAKTKTSANVLKGPDAAQRRTLIERRIELARESLQLDYERTRELGLDRQSVRQMLAFSRRLMEERLAIAANPDDRLAAIHEHRQFTSEIEEAVAIFVKGGELRLSDLLKVRYDRMKADDLQARAEGQGQQADKPPEPGVN